MDRRNKKLLALYRRHILNRLEYAYSDGDLSVEEYNRLQADVAKTRKLSGLRRIVGDLREQQAASSNRWATSRWIPTRRERRLRSERRWWKPERLWVVGLLLAVLIGVMVLVGLMMATEWFSSAG
jgi:hypothetical protein